jgi:hypothetical protein
MVELVYEPSVERIFFGFNPLAFSDATASFLRGTENRRSLPLCRESLMPEVRDVEELDERGRVCAANLQPRRQVRGHLMSSR